MYMSSRSGKHLRQPVGGCRRRVVCVCVWLGGGGGQPAAFNSSLPMAAAKCQTDNNLHSNVWIYMLLCITATRHSTCKLTAAVYARCTALGRKVSPSHSRPPGKLLHPRGQRPGSTSMRLLFWAAACRLLLPSPPVQAQLAAVAWLLAGVAWCVQSQAACRFKQHIGRLHT